MPEPVRICPYYRKPCAEAREELHLRGQECDFITRMQVVKPSILAGTPPSVTTVDICVVRSLQQAMNALNDGMSIVLQLLKEQRAGMIPPFSKG